MTMTMYRSIYKTAGVIEADCQLCLMPGTVAIEGECLVDMLTAELPVVADGVLLAQWQMIDGEPVVVVPADMDEIMAFVPDIEELDEAGEAIGTSPAPRRLPHNWAGWA